MKKQQSGFTLIELVMVIVVLGILSAFALPKFANLTGDARLASMQGALSAVKSASAITYSAALAKNDADLGLVTMSDGTDITLVNLYPAPIQLGGIIDAAGIDINDPAYEVRVDTAGDAVHFLAKGQPGCYFSYTMGDTDVTPTINTENLNSGTCVDGNAPTQAAPAAN